MKLRPWDAFDVLVMFAIAAVLGVVCAVKDASAAGPSECDARESGYADESGRLEFVRPFEAEPMCNCAPGPCAVLASPDGAEYVPPFGRAVPKRARLSCWRGR